MSEHKRGAPGSEPESAVPHAGHSQAALVDRIGVQFSLYPLRQAHLKPALRGAVQAAIDAGLPVRVGPLSSVAAADEETVFRALRAAFRAAGEHGPAVMVATLSTRLPSDLSIAAVQGSGGDVTEPE